MSGVDAGRDAQFDGALAFDAALAFAFEAAFFNDLSGALARRASAIDGEETLLIDHLAASAAGLAGDDAGALLRARAVAGFAIFLARDADFGGDARRRFFKAERHVVAQIGAALLTCAAATTRAASAKEVLEAEEVPEDVVEVLENGAVKPGLPARASQTGVTVGVVDLAFLRVAQDRVGFGAFAEADFRLFFIFGIAVGMPLQGGFAVGRLDLFHRSGFADAQDFVKITLLLSTHARAGSSFPLVRTGRALAWLRIPIRWSSFEKRYLTTALTGFSSICSLRYTRELMS